MPIYNNKDYIRIIRPLPSTTIRDVYGIPFIEKQDIDISKMNNGQWLINLNNAFSTDKHAATKIVHSFSYDNVLLRYYNNPIKFLEKTAKYYAISSFDFSMHSNISRSITGTRNKA